LVDIREEIESGRDLLALPEAAQRILALTGQADVSIGQLTVAISKDPALAGRLLKIVNSSFYALSQRVGSIQQAIMILGTTTVKCLVLSAGLFDPKTIPADGVIDIRAWYGNIISVATTCRKLAVACDYHLPEDAFTAGLLHDIGWLYFMQNYPDKCGEIIRRTRQGGVLTQEEDRLLGISHSEAGSLLARKWNLPEHIVEAIGNHHTCGFRESETLDDIMRLAVALNYQSEISASCLEERIVKITTISGRLGIELSRLSDISASIVSDTYNFAQMIDVDIYDYEALLTRTNQEIFRIYLDVIKLFRERRDLTRHILDEEKARGVQEAKQVALSTLSHYINNAAMVISGQSQVLRLSLKNKGQDEVHAMIPRLLDTIDESIRRIIAVLEELSELNIHDDVVFFEKSQIINIDERINERHRRLNKVLPFGQPSEVTVDPD